MVEYNRGNPELTARLCAMSLDEVVAYCTAVLEERLQDISPTVQRLIDTWDAQAAPRQPVVSVPRQPAPTKREVRRRLLADVAIYLERRTA